MYYTTDYSYYNTGYDYVDSSATAAAGIFGAATAAVSAIAWIISIAASVISIIAMWKVFKKAGRGGWEAIVPFYNIYTLLEISGIPGSKMFLGFIPAAGIVILIVYLIKAAISLNQKFRKPGGFAVLLILVPVVGMAILGFGKDKYDGKYGLQK